MPQHDDFLLRGALRRLQVVDVVRRAVPDVGNGDDTEAVPENVQQDVQAPVQQARGEVTQARGGNKIKIDEEARDWIKVVRDGGGGLMIGPEDGIIAVPEGASERTEKEPVVEDEPDDEPKTVDDVRALGREELAQTFEDEEEVDGAIQKTLFAIRQLMAGVERRFVERRKHD